MLKNIDNLCKKTWCKLWTLGHARPAKEVPSLSSSQSLMLLEKDLTGLVNQWRSARCRLHHLCQH